MSVSGYASATSVIPGQRIDLFLSGDPPGPASFAVERVGGGDGTTLTTVIENRRAPAGRAWEGFGWPVSHTFEVPPTWATGLYRLTHRADGAEVLAFVVLPAARAQLSTALLHISFLTPQAYNPAGGKSLYGFNSDPGQDEASRASRVSFDRPWGAGPPSVERPLIEWFSAEGIVVEYCSSIDLHADPSLLSSYECLVLAGHDEYWTKEMRDQAEGFVANGGNLVVLSGNTCYRQVRLEDGDRTVVFHKYAGQDPHPDNGRVTVAWAEPPVNRPQNSLLGVGFTAGAYRGPPSAYAIRFPGHWVFDGAPLAPGQVPRTEPFMHYETDAAAFVEEDEGYPRVTSEEDTPLSYVVLGSADLRSWEGKPGYATMGLFSRNGSVFSAGTTEWVERLAIDPTIAQVTRNVLDRLGQRLVWDWEEVGGADGGRALTAAEDRLWLAAADQGLWRRHPVGADVPWRRVGSANDVRSLAGLGETLFAVTADNRLWWRLAREADLDWRAVGSGPDGGTRALAAVAGMLYAVDQAGRLWRAAADRSAPAWAPIPTFGGVEPAVSAMAAWSDILFASTGDGRLLRSDRDWINESSGWTRIHHVNRAAGLGVVDGMLFVATTDDLVWRLDLHGLRQP